MLELPRLTLLILRLSLFRVLRARRTLFGALLCALPPAIAWLVFSTGKEIAGDPVVTHLGWFLGLQVVLPLLSLLGGSAVIAEELENRTLTYVFTRPVPRAALFLGRTLATLAWTALGLALMLGGMLLVVRLSGAEPVSPGVAGPLLRAYVLGAAAYTAIFAALGTWTRHPMIVGAAYTFAIEGFLANLPGQNASLTVQHWLRSFVLASGSETAFGAAEFVGGDASAAQALTRLLVILGVTLVAGSLIVSRRQYVLPA
jgi:ABC-type transport system involved in multi-copper enzyme maturation permease subunit